MCVTVYRDQYHRSLMPIYLPEKSCNMVSGEHTEGNNGSRRCFTLTHPPSQFVFYGQGPNVPLGKPNSKLFVIVPLLSSLSYHMLSSISMCSQAQMSPMGSGGRGNYSSQSPSSLAKQSPSLAKRANGLQLRQQQQDPIAPCHKNIWPNPMQGLPGGCLGVVRMMPIAFVFRSRHDLSAVPASPELSTHPKEPACPAV